MWLNGTAEWDLIVKWVQWAHNYMGESEDEAYCTNQGAMWEHDDMR